MAQDFFVLHENCIALAPVLTWGWIYQLRTGRLGRLGGRLMDQSYSTKRVTRVTEQLKYLTATWIFDNHDRVRLEENKILRALVHPPSPPRLVRRKSSVLCPVFVGM